MICKLKHVLIGKKLIFYSLLIFFAAVTVFFVNNNERFYHNTIGSILAIKEEKRLDSSKSGDLLEQTLSVRILNGRDRGETLEVNNSYSSTGAYDYRFQVGDKVFLKLKSPSGELIAPTITGVKRDLYLVITAWVFFLFILFIGKKRGFLSALSLGVNIIAFYYALDLYLRGVNLILLCALLIIAFTFFTMILVLGRNKKAYASILSTLAATFCTILISYFVMLLTNNSGMRFEEMQFITRPIEPIFLSEILLGSFGAIMDVVITITSSLYELSASTQDSKALMKSGSEIGRDIMGSMCNVLLLAYISGSIPMILLYMKNGMPVFNSFYSNLSLELVRVLTGSIGIVLSIPITINITLFFLKGLKRGTHE